MTIVGVGLDVVDVAGFGVQLADPASGFVAATFRASERRPVPTDPADPVRLTLHLAGRFAAKEALVKAWSAARRGQPPVLQGIDLRDIEVVDDGFGRPGLRLHGAVAEAVSRLTREGTVTTHLSISHDGPVAAAVVLLEVLPARSSTM